MRAASAFDWNDNTKQYVNLNWTHWTALGYATMSVSGDTDFGDVRSVGVGHHFDDLIVEDWTLHFTANNTLDEGWQPGFFVEKYFADRRFRATFNVQPLTKDKSISGSGWFLDRRLYLRASYNFDREAATASSNIRIWNNTGIFLTGRKDADGEFTGIGGLTVHFETGTPTYRDRRQRQQKPIEWLDD